MSERKPPEMSFRTWIDQQISQAEERGAFDNLPGAGKPLPRGDDADDGQAWLRDYVRREGVPSEALLPLPLRLRKEAERLAEAAPLLASEQAVRDMAAELNGRILEWRRIPVGPPVYVSLADEEALAARWREAHPAGAEPAPGHGEPGSPRPGREVGRRRWWRRFIRSG
jgi:DnaJ-like protein